jgi:hypothetical protein
VLYAGDFIQQRCILLTTLQGILERSSGAIRNNCNFYCLPHGSERFASVAGWAMWLPVIGTVLVVGILWLYNARYDDFSQNYESMAFDAVSEKV